MKSTGKILTIDDDPAFLQIYESELGEQGYLVETASDTPAALAKLDQGDWDAVLVDQRLQGVDTGLDLLAEVPRRTLGAKAILVTAYANSEAITRAFREGAYDYLEKGKFFRELLLAKLRNAVETVRAQRFGELSSDETEATIRETWAEVESEQDSNRKGRLLEDLMVLLFKTIPGFHQASPRRRNEVEEIDVLIRNESRDPLWMNEQPSYILVECKNWSKPVGSDEIRAFFSKLLRRYGRCRLGFFVAPGGFTGPLKEDLRAERKGDILVVLLGRAELRELVLSGDRNALLKRFHEKAVVELNGH